MNILMQLGRVTLLGLSCPVMASNIAYQTINMRVSAVNELSVVSSTITLYANSATAGHAPGTATDTTVAVITTNEPNGVIVKKVTTVLSADMPAGTTLTGTYAAPNTVWNASQGGTTLLSTAEADAVSNLSGHGGTQARLTITYDFDVQTAVNPSTFSRVVTLTLVNQ